MKKSRIMLMLPVALAMLLASCGPNNAGSTTSVAGGGSGGGFVKEKTDIYFWHTFSYVTELENIVNAFQKIEPNVTVHLEKQNGGYDGLKTTVINGIAAGNTPDLVLAYPDHVAEYLDYGIAVDADPYINNEEYGWTEEEYNDVIPNFMEEGQSYSIPGTYSLPMAKSTEAMFYNEDVLIGLDLSAYDSTINNGEALDADYLNNLTWEELFNKLCPAITAYNDAQPATEKILLENEAYHGIFAYDSDDNLFITLAKQYGYGYTELNETTGTGEILFNNPEMKSLMKVFNDAANKGYIITKGTSGGNYTNEFFTKQNTLFSVGSTGGYKYQVADTFDVGVANIPRAEGKDYYVINQGPSIAMLETNKANTENRKLATWLFYKFLTNAENTLYWGTQTGYMPVRLSSYESDAYLDYISLEGKSEYSPELLAAKVGVYSQTIASSGSLFVSAVFKGSSTARQQAASVMSQVLLASKELCTDNWLNGIFETAVNQTKLAM